MNRLRIVSYEISGRSCIDCEQSLTLAIPGKYARAQENGLLAGTRFRARARVCFAGIAKVRDYLTRSLCINDHRSRMQPYLFSDHLSMTRDCPSKSLDLSMIVPIFHFSLKSLYLRPSRKRPLLLSNHDSLHFGWSLTEVRLCSKTHIDLSYLLPRISWFSRPVDLSSRPNLLDVVGEGRFVEAVINKKRGMRKCKAVQI